MALRWPYIAGAAALLLCGISGVVVWRADVRMREFHGHSTAAPTSETSTEVLVAQVDALIHAGDDNARAIQRAFVLLLAGAVLAPCPSTVWLG